MTDNAVALQLRTLLDRVDRGEVSLRRGEELACAVFDTALPTVDDVEHLAQEVTTRARMDPLGARSLARLLAAAFDTPCPLVGGETQWTAALLAWVEVAGRFLEEAPDARDLRHAHKRGERVRRWAAQAQASGVRAQSCQLLAELHLRSYSTPGATYAELETYDWAGRLGLVIDERQALDLISVGSFEYPDNHLRPPPWAQSAWTAETYLRESLAVAMPQQRPTTCATLARVLDARRRQGITVDLDELANLVDEAFTSSEGLARGGVLAVRHRISGIDETRTWARLAEEVDIGMEASILGARDTALVLIEALDALVEAEPSLALDLAIRMESLVLSFNDDRLKEGLWVRRLMAAARTGDLHPNAPCYKEHPFDVTSEQKALLSAMDIVRQGNWGDAENLLSSLQAGSGDLARAHEAPIAWLVTWERLGVAYSVPTPERLRMLSEIILELLRLGLRWRALVVIASTILPLLENLSTEEASQLTRLIGKTAIPLELAIGDGANHLIREVAIHASAVLIKDDDSHEDLIRLIQVAGGARYAAAVRAGARVDLSDDLEYTRLMTWVRHWEEHTHASGLAVPGVESTVGDDQSLNDVLVTSYVSTGEPSGGKSAEAVLGNLQMRVDALLGQRLLSTVDGRTLPVLGVEEIRAQLDERTAVLLMFVGRSNPPRGPQQILTVLVHSDEIAASAVVQERLSGDAIFIDDPNEEALWVTTDMGITLAQLRTRLRDYCRPDLMSPTAEEMFDGDARIEHYLGPEVRLTLARLHEKGVDHLCVVPSGPLRTFPIHLLGAPHRCLADDWIVTYLPHPAILDKSSVPPPPERGKPVTSVGLSYRRIGMVDAGHAPIDTADQAQAVASVFGCRATLDFDATRETVLDGMHWSRYVHIAAHGSFNYCAPAFQGIYLADGRLSSHEFLGLNLQGLELVTLSACESALGRFDMADNPRGVPATLLLAGASAVVGTLWPLKASVAATFFTTLYGELARETPALDAYAVALRLTRRTHGEYRDWGAFYFIGDWRSTDRRV